MAKKRKSNQLVGYNEGGWEAEEDLRCYMRVCEIKKDKVRMQRVHKLAKEKLEEAARVAAATGQGGEA